MKKDFPGPVKKVLATLLYCLIFSGGLFYLDIFMNPSMENLKKFLWSLLLGVGFSYLYGFKFNAQNKIT